MTTPKSRPPTPALFTDRDGVINEEVGFVRDPGDIRLIPGVAAAVRRFNDAGIAVVVVSNQSGVARGLMTFEEMLMVQKRVDELLWQEASAWLAGSFFAPHHPEGVVPEFTGDSEDRKPRGGMFFKAAQQLNLDLARSWIIGDRLTDLEAGRSAGLAGGVLVKTGYGEKSFLQAKDLLPPPWDWVAESLPETAGRLLAKMVVRGA